jgi:hypothetical protein
VEFLLSYCDPFIKPNLKSAMPKRKASPVKDFSEIASAAPRDNDDDDDQDNIFNSMPPPSKRTCLERVPSVSQSSFVEPSASTNLKIMIRESNACWACDERVALDIAHLLPRDRTWVCNPLHPSTASTIDLISHSFNCINLVG